MRTDLVPATEALSIILRDASPTGEENVAIGEAAGRILSRDLVALRTQPPFRSSAMDGYAVRGADIAEVPVTLELIGESAAGNAFSGSVASGQAVRIFTGAPVPEGADTVVMQENTRAEPGSVTIFLTAATGKSVRKAGLDFQRGDSLLSAGFVLDPQRLSLAASMNYAIVPVWRKPVVAIASTGSELRLPGAEPGPDQIIASNAFGLAAIVRQAGGEVLDLGILRDDRGVLAATFTRALDGGADLLLTLGGASVGDHDLVLPVLRELGATFHFSKIALRPGKPLLAGEIEHNGRKVRILGLAGNPVSSLVAGNVFVAPLVAAMAGRNSGRTQPVPAVLGCDLAQNDERQDYLRASAIRRDDGQLEVTPFRVQDSSMLAALVRADVLLVRPAGAGPAEAGDPCSVILLRDI